MYAWPFFVLFYFNLYTFSTQGSFVERAQYSLQSLIEKSIYESDSKYFLPSLPKLVQTYNARVNRTTGLSPNEMEDPANHDRMIDQFERDYAKRYKRFLKPVLKLHDLVRIRREMGRMRRGYQSNFVETVYEISNIHTEFRIPLYSLQTLVDKEPMESRWYHFELSPLSPHMGFLPSEIIKKEKGHVTVNFIGLPSDITLRVPKASFSKNKRYKPLLHL